MAAALATLGLAPRQLDALPVRTTAGHVLGEGEVRYPLPGDDGVTIDRQNEVILVRWQNTVYAFALSCPHQRTVLKWREKEQRFQCPKHKSKYKPNGEFISGRATRGMDRYPLRRRGSDILVNTATAIRQDDNPTAWGRASVSLRGTPR